VLVFGKIANYEEKLIEDYIDIFEFISNSNLDTVNIGKWYDSINKYAKDNYPEYEMSYGIGHGIGVNVHEGFSLYQKENHSFTEGMTMCLEPIIHDKSSGLYIRMEEMFLIENNRMNRMIEKFDYIYYLNEDLSKYIIETDKYSIVKNRFKYEDKNFIWYFFDDIDYLFEGGAFVIKLDILSSELYELAKNHPEDFELRLKKHLKKYFGKNQIKINQYLEVFINNFKILGIIK